MNNDSTIQLHTIIEDQKDGSIATSSNSSQICAGTSSSTSSGAAREARSLQRRLIAYNDIHEVFKFSQLKVKVLTF